MDAEIYDETTCSLGEGPLWHPLREELFWFDIVAKRLYRREGEKISKWQFSEHVSAAGWIDRDSLLVASQSSLGLGRLRRLVAEAVRQYSLQTANVRTTFGSSSSAA